jgi:hypothetical protein
MSRVTASPSLTLQARGQGDVVAPADRIIQAVPSNFGEFEFHALLNLDIPTDTNNATRDFLLVPGRSAMVEFQTPNGERLGGAVIVSDPPTSESHRGIVHLRPRKFVQAVSPDQRLAGRFQLRGDEKGIVKVKLEPWRTATGQVADSDGRPIANAVLMFESENSSKSSDEPIGFWYKGTPIRTDKEGRFRIDGLVPNASYSLLIWAEDQPGQRLEFRADWKAGETKDLGTIKTREPSK